MIGETLNGKYVILRLLGEGGMGAVYEARHTGTGERVAVKVIVGGALQKGDDRVSRFHREVKAARGIDSPHIAHVLDAGTNPVTGAPYFVLEYLEGEDLQQLLKRVGPLSSDVALRIVAQACVGLQKAHDARIIHRDIKPANLFLAQRDDGEITVKILDFGIAKIRPAEPRDEETTELTRTGAMLGSPLYMSPEQARGIRGIDHRSDIWSLGIVLYRALSGRAPHGSIDAFGDLIMALCLEAPAPIQSVAPWIPPEIAAVVHGALQLDQASRFQSATAMLDAILPLLPGGFTLRQEHLATLGSLEQSVIAPKIEIDRHAAYALTKRVVMPPVTMRSQITGSRQNRQNTTARHRSRSRPPVRAPD